MWPPLDSEWQLAPNVGGGFCYFSVASGAVSWEPPEGSTATPPNPLPRLPFKEPPLHGACTVVSPPMPWVVRYRGAEVFYLSLRTGALRRGSWLSLHEPTGGQPYAFNPSTGESRWVPPPGWMAD